VVQKVTVPKVNAAMVWKVATLAKTQPVYIKENAIAYIWVGYGFPVFVFWVFMENAIHGVSVGYS
jgi:hypothetical protein